MTGFAPPYPDLSELLPPSEVAARAVVGQPVDDPFDEDDEFAKRWYVAPSGSSYIVVEGDWARSGTFGPFSWNEAHQFVKDMIDVHVVMDR